jgi:uncharacterized C2H2 Zn-finger protein
MDSARLFCQLLTRRRKAYKQARDKAHGSNWERIESFPRTRQVRFEQASQQLGKN